MCAGGGGEEERRPIVRVGGRRGGWLDGCGGYWWEGQMLCLHTVQYRRSGEMQKRRHELRRLSIRIKDVGTSTPLRNV